VAIVYPDTSEARGLWPNGFTPARIIGVDFLPAKTTQNPIFVVRWQSMKTRVELRTYHIVHTSGIMGMEKLLWACHLPYDLEMDSNDLVGKKVIVYKQDQQSYPRFDRHNG
jgi:hypothetical protein